jgi:hypothetical protein
MIEACEFACGFTRRALLNQLKQKSESHEPKPSDEAQRIGDDLSDEALLAKYVELERFAETNGESWADGFVRVQFKRAVLKRMGRKDPPPT